MLTWDEVRQKKPLYINLGGRGHCHPHPRYVQYVSVDLKPGEGWRVLHDLMDPIPLPDASTDRIHTEDALHYLERPAIQALLSECYRILKPGACLRIGVTDYNHPKDRFCLKEGKDPRHPLHRTLTTKPLLEELLHASPFRHYEFLQYWQGDTFVEHPIDYAKGWINRTPDHDPRCRHIRLKGYVHNALLLLRKGFRLSSAERAMLEGNRHFVTSLVVDCIKEE